MDRKYLLIITLLLPGLCFAQPETGEALVVQINEQIDEQKSSPSEEPIKQEKQQLEPDEIPPKSFIILDAPHKFISEKIDLLAHKIDVFFGGARAYDEATGSFIQLNMNTQKTEGMPTVNQTNMRAKLELPNTEQKLSLLFENEPDGTQISSGSGQLASDLGDSTSSAALSAILQESKWWQFSTDVGVRFNVGYEPFVRLKGHRKQPFDVWQSRLGGTLLWKESAGYEAKTELNLDRPMGEDFLFRISSLAVWHEIVRETDYGHSISLYQDLGRSRSLVYRISMQDINDPVNYETSYAIDLAYRKRIYKHWLFMEINPALVYQEKNDFEQERRMTLSLQAMFEHRNH